MGLKVKQIVKQGGNTMKRTSNHCLFPLSSDILKRAPVAQRIEQRFPKPRARVRVPAGVPVLNINKEAFKCRNTGSTTFIW